jgi:germination protein M
MADYALTLTLTQLPQIMSVRINVQGRELAYRDTQVLTPQTILLAPEGDILGTVAAKLYFVNEILELQAEERILELYEGDTQIAAVVQALKDGPEENGLFPVLSEDFRIGKVWLEDTVCYINLSSALLESMEYTEGLPVALQALGRSLCSLDTVEEVRYLVDGEVADRYGSADISEPYTEN